LRLLSGDDPFQIAHPGGATAYVCLRHERSFPSQPHPVTFGNWTTVQWFPDTGPTGEKSFALKVRPWLVTANGERLLLRPGSSEGF